MPRPTSHLVLLLLAFPLLLLLAFPLLHTLPSLTYPSLSYIPFPLIHTLGPFFRISTLGTQVNDGGMSGGVLGVHETIAARERVRGPLLRHHLRNDLQLWSVCVRV